MKQYRKHMGRSAAIAALVAAGLFLSSALVAGNIVSIPAGFVQVEVAPESSAVLSMPFVPFNDAVEAVCVGRTSESLIIRKWDALDQVYVSAPLQQGEDPSGMTLISGEGFLLRNPEVDAASVFLCGWIVLAPEQRTDMYPGFNLFGYPYSTGMRLNETELPGAVSILPLYGTGCRAYAVGRLTWKGWSAGLRWRQDWFKGRASRREAAMQVDVATR